jgi:hypothetical protein
MKRDMDLVRDILGKLEAAEPGAGVPADAFPGHAPQVVACHFKLLAEAGYLDANLYELEELGPLDGSVQRLTWQGHEFLDATRDATIWRRVKAKAAEHGGSVPIGIAKDLALLYLKQTLGLVDS